MTVLPDLQAELVRAATRPTAYGPEHGPRRRLVPILAVGIAALLAVLGLLTFGGRNVASTATAAARVLEHTARVAERGLAAPRLRPDQAWYTSAVHVEASTWQPFVPGRVPAPPNRGGTGAGPRAVVLSRFRIETWVGYDATMRFRSRLVGHPRFFGSARDRARWTAAGASPPVLIGSGGTIGATGFTVGEKNLSYQQVLGFPTDPAGVLRFLRTAEAPNSDPIGEITELLVDVPLLAPARAAVFRATAQLRGVRYLGPVKDPLGRRGVAIGVAHAQALQPDSNSREHVISELIFDPDTAALLAERTVLLDPPPVPGIRTGSALTWTAYVQSRAIPRSSFPTIQQVEPRG